jgi:hypothetical protein
LRAWRSRWISLHSDCRRSGHKVDPRRSAWRAQRGLSLGFRGPLQNLGRHRTRTGCRLDSVGCSALAPRPPRLAGHMACGRGFGSPQLLGVDVCSPSAALLRARPIFSTRFKSKSLSLSLSLSLSAVSSHFQGRKLEKAGKSPILDRQGMSHSYCLFVCLSVCQSVCVSVCLPVCLFPSGTWDDTLVEN